MSARSYGEFEFWFSSIKVAIIVFIALAGRMRRLDFAAGRRLAISPVMRFMPHGFVAVLVRCNCVFSLTALRLLSWRCGIERAHARRGRDVDIGYC